MSTGYGFLAKFYLKMEKKKKKIPQQQNKLKEINKVNDQIKVVALQRAPNKRQQHYTPTNKIIITATKINEIFFLLNAVDYLFYLVLAVVLRFYVVVCTFRNSVHVYRMCVRIQFLAFV